MSKYKNIQNKKSINKYKSPKVKINKIDSNEDNIKPKNSKNTTKNSSKKIVDKIPKKIKKKNLTKKKRIEKS